MFLSESCHGILSQIFVTFQMSLNICNICHICPSQGQCLPIGDGDGQGPALYLESSGFTNSSRSDCCLNWLVHAVKGEDAVQDAEVAEDQVQDAVQDAGQDAVQVQVEEPKNAGPQAKSPTKAKYPTKAKAKAADKAKPKVTQIVTHRIVYKSFEIQALGKTYKYDAPYLRQLKQDETKAPDGVSELKPYREAMPWDATEQESRRSGKDKQASSACFNFIVS